MKVKDYISDAYERAWGYIPTQRKAEVIAQALGGFGNTTSVTNPIVQQIANAKWADMPQYIKLTIEPHFEDEYRR